MAITAVEQHLLDLINGDRKAAGLQPLRFDAELDRAADGHTNWMDANDVLSHTGINGSNPGARIKAESYDAVRWSENVAYSSDKATPGLDNADAAGLHQSLMNSSGHRANILDPNVSEVGLGLKMGTMNGKPTAYVTEVFGSPSKSEAGEGDKGGGGAAPAPAPLPVPKPVPVPAEPIKGIVKVAGWGDQILKGTGGDDFLTGGAGRDTLTGGHGKDTFVFTHVRDAGDTITDFKAGVDKIDLHMIKHQINQYDTAKGMIIEVDMGAAPDIAMVLLAGVHTPLGAESFV